jgi:MOSC domain-containing protein YiiM
MTADAAPRPVSPAPGPQGQVVAVCVGAAVPRLMGGRRVLSGIGKAPVAGAVAVGRLGLAGDEQADLSVHGGLDKAVYACAVEHGAWWQAQRRHHGATLFDEPLPPGFLGENLALRGVREHDIWIGDELHLPDCVLRVTAPREPCFKFTTVMGYAQAARDMVAASASGFYLAVVQPGTVAAGQTFTVVPGPRGLSVAQAFAAKRVKHLR